MKYILALLGAMGIGLMSVSVGVWTGAPWLAGWIGGALSSAFIGVALSMLARGAETRHKE